MIFIINKNLKPGNPIIVVPEKVIIGSLNMFFFFAVLEHPVLYGILASVQVKFRFSFVKLWKSKDFYSKKHIQTPI